MIFNSILLGSEKLDPATNIETKTVTLEYGAWQYYEFDVTQEIKNSKKKIIFTLDRISFGGDPDLYVSYDSFPSLVSYLDALLEPGDSKDTQLEINLDEIPIGNYKIGIYAYCCTSVTAKLTVWYS
jgi:hypothetical protein